jgi:hypothetical protein
MKLMTKISIKMRRKFDKSFKRSHAKESGNTRMQKMGLKRPESEAKASAVALWAMADKKA